MLFQHDRELILQLGTELECCKQMLWKQTQSLLAHVQSQRREIEEIAGVITERRRERDELLEMRKAMPKVGWFGWDALYSIRLCD